MTTILLTAANGRTGRPVLRALKAKGLTVKVFIRDETQWPELQALGADSYALGNMDDAGSIQAALKGCDKLVHIGPPMHPDEKAITERFIAAGKAVGLKHFIYYSVMHPLRREVRHHRLKLDTEEVLIESGLPYTILQPIRYMQHLEPQWNKVVSEGVHAMPFNTHLKFNVVDLEDLALAVATVAVDESHCYATYELAGPEALSQDDMARIISEEIGRDVEARQTPLEKVAEVGKAKGFSEDKIEQMQIMNKHYDEFGFLGNPNVLRWLIGKEPTRYRDYIKRLNQ